MDLDDWRSRINNLDAEILNLLNQRGLVALQIGELKRQQDLPYFSPEREAQVLLAEIPDVGQDGGEGVVGFERGGGAAQHDRAGSDARASQLSGLF